MTVAQESAAVLAARARASGAWQEPPRRHHPLQTGDTYSVPVNGLHRSTDARPIFCSIRRSRIPEGGLARATRPSCWPSAQRTGVALDHPGDVATAELHRHLPDRDDCIDCRLPDTTAPRMQCSTGPTDATDSTSPAAALSFLSAVAGLMLAGVLATLPDGPAMAGRFNHWRLDLTMSTPLIRMHQHQQRQACREQPSATLRGLIAEAEPRRWDYLDHADE
jgi:hypothetical protein